MPKVFGWVITVQRTDAAAPFQSSHQQQSRGRSSLGLLLRILLFASLLLAGTALLFVPVLLHFAVNGSWSNGLGAALLWSLACLASGGAIGFLFALPKVLQKNTEREYNLVFNTSLEKISEWLCTIIVGLGLVELRSLPENLASMAEYLASDLGGEAYQAFAGGLIVYFAATGFLCGYLITRLCLNRSLARADREALRDDLDEKIAKQIRIENQEFRRQRLEMAWLMGKTAQSKGATENYVEDVRKKLAEILKEDPGNRRLGIILAWLYSEKALAGEDRGKNVDRAIDILQNVLSALKERADANPIDVADLHYNLTAYFQRKRAAAQSDPEQTVLKSLVYQNLEAALANPGNIQEAEETDDDFAGLRGEQEFKDLIQKAKAAAAKGQATGPKSS